jgi:hypothetical protein
VIYDNTKLDKLELAIGVLMATTFITFIIICANAIAAGAGKAF